MDVIRILFLADQVKNKCLQIDLNELQMKPPPRIDSAAIYLLATFTVSLWIALYIWTRLQFIMLPCQFNDDCE